MPTEPLGNDGCIARQLHSKDALPYLPYMPAGWSPRLWSDTRACFKFLNRDEWRNELELLNLPNLGLPLPDGRAGYLKKSFLWNRNNEPKG